MLDHYWLETAEFVRARLGRSQTVIGPRDFMCALPQVTPYESCTLQLLERRCHFIVHKGMADQIYQPFLYTAMLAGELVFSNEVFLVLDIAGGESARHMRHAKSFVETLPRGRSGPAPAMATARNPSCYLGNSRAICTTVHGHKMIVDTNDLSLTPHLLTDGYWEDWITAFIKRTVQPGWRVVEVGANFGYYTLLMADRVGPGGSVLAFEANPHLCDILRTNVEINGFRDRARAVPTVVTDTSKAATEFRLYKRHLADSSLFATSERAEMFADDLETIKVAAVALDDYFEVEGPIDFVKIDAEGAEPLILRGARRLLAANPSVRMLVELVPEYVQATMEPHDFLGFIRSLGFAIMRVDEDGRIRHAPDDELLARPYSELFMQRPA